MTQVKFSNRPFETGFNSFVDNLFTGLPVIFNKEFNQTERKGFAPVNVKETEDNYLVEVVAPGFDKTDLKVNINQGLLTISGERKEEEQKTKGNNKDPKDIRKEYNYRSFKRSFTLDEKIDATNIDANYVNGILILNLPK